MLIHILTNLTKKEAESLNIDYIRILGFSTKGRQYLNKIKKNIDIKIVTNYKENISKLFDLEYRINSIYSSNIDNNLIKEEISHNPIIKD